jgi:hypothetical protein
VGHLELVLETWVRFFSDRFGKRGNSKPNKGAWKKYRHVEVL